jgi:alpha-tubulin suppressor-like RCC1 family protein
LTPTLASSFDMMAGLVEVSGGTDFAAGRTQDGSLYAWGNNVQGQLGVNDQRKCEVLFEVSPLSIV